MEWTIQDMGAAGEFVGSIAVLFTLVYLAYQTRAARHATELQMVIAASHPVIEINNAIVGSSPECADAIFKGRNGQELTDRELSFYATVTYSYISTLTTLFLAPDSAGKQRIIAGYDFAIRSWWSDSNFIKLCKTGFLLPFPAAVREHIESFRPASSDYA